MVESKIRDPNRRSMEGLRKSNPGLKLPIPARDSAPPHPLPLPLPLPLPPLPSGTVPCKLPCPPADGRDVALDDLIKLEPLGQGNGGKVYKVQHKVTKAFYALKIIQDKHDPAVRKHIIKEIQISRRFCAKSQHVVQCYGVSERGGEISLILEYMDGGTLQQALSAQKKISEAQLAEVTRQVLKGLRYLHSNKIVHRDIKPSNLLMNRRKEVKIADFGVSTELAHTLAQCDSFVGTYAYMSPERWDPDGNGGHYDCSADIWSLGLTLLECAVGHFPCLAPGQKADWPTLMWAICMVDPPSPPADSSPEFRSFIKCCLHKDAVRRPSAAALLNHPFLKKYENQHSSLSPLLSSLHL